MTPYTGTLFINLYAFVNSNVIGSDDFLLLDGTDFLLLTGENFLLLTP